MCIKPRRSGMICSGKSPIFSGQAIIDAALTQRRIMGGDLNTALSRYGCAQSTRALYDKVDKFSQDFVHEYMHNHCGKAQQAKFIGWVQNAMTMHSYRAQSVETFSRIAKAKW